MLGDAFWLLTVAILWGSTNPLLKKYSTGIENIKSNGKVSTACLELKFLFLNWKYLLSFMTNQMGSVLYYLTLASADLTLAVPITNSLTLIATAFSSHMLGDKNLSFTEKFVYIEVDQMKSELISPEIAARVVCSVLHALVMTSQSRSTCHVLFKCLGH